MSPLTHFMSTARAVLDEKDRKAAPKQQPPFFVRTTWLFAEIEELALPGEVETFKAIKIARLGGDVTAIARLVNQLGVNTEAMPAGRGRHERKQLVAWINEQIEREWHR